MDASYRLTLTREGRDLLEMLLECYVADTQDEEDVADEAYRALRRAEEA